MELSFENIIRWVNVPIIHIGGTPLTIGGVCAAMLVFTGSFIVSNIVRNALSVHLEKKFNFTSGMSYAVLRIIHYIVIILGFVVAAQIIGFNFGSLAVLFGFLSVGIGFGLQNITSNFISGLILLIERPISVGDFISVVDQVGRVVRINMRSTMIMTVDNVVIIVPNSKFVENNVINWSIEDSRVRIHCPVGIGYGSDVAKVKEVLINVAKDNPDVLEFPEPEVRFKSFGDSSLDFDLLIWTDEPKKQFLLTSNINFAIDEAFRKADIRIPFPQRDIHIQSTPVMENYIKG